MFEPSAAEYKGSEWEDGKAIRKTEQQSTIKLIRRTRKPIVADIPVSDVSKSSKSK